MDKRLVIAYREFARVNFFKYGTQFPMLRESEVIEKINKEWDCKTREEKILYYELKARFTYKTHSSDSEEGSSVQEEPSQERKSPKKKMIKKIKSPKTRIFREKRTIKKLVDFGDSDNESVVIEVQDEKKDVENSKKNRAMLRFEFTKYYHEKLSKQHPNWNEEKLDRIIGLLWQKRNRPIRRRIFKRTVKKLPKLSAIQLYTQVKNNELEISKENARTLWNSLPHESKIYWRNIAKKRNQYQTEDLEELKNIPNESKQYVNEAHKKLLMLLKKQMSFPSVETAHMDEVISRRLEKDEMKKKEIERKIASEMFECKMALENRISNEIEHRKFLSKVRNEEIPMDFGKLSDYNEIIEQIVTEHVIEIYEGREMKKIHWSEWILSVVSTWK